jgi:hypothetical protein
MGSCRGFISAYATRENAGIAQLVEQLICNQQVVGSNPTAGSLHYQALMLILAAPRKSVFAI